jgi:hypothetical protein
MVLATGVSLLGEALIFSLYQWDHFAENLDTDVLTVEHIKM